MRYIVTFKPTSTLADKVMVFTDMYKQQVHDLMYSNYGYTVDRILTEQEFSPELYQTYQRNNQIVKYGEKCCIYHNGKEMCYPQTFTSSKPETKKSIKNPEPMEFC